jgi:two-component system sensor histidine kinase PilS (NtrC family)
MIASILLYIKGSLIIAFICSLEYGLMLFLENSGWLTPMAIGKSMEAVNDYSMEALLYKTLITGGACLAVAVLSGVLAEQTKKSRKELLEMENHVKRVEKMAYIGRMAANLAHEIKNPLASLAGSIQLLREEIPYDANQDKLMQIVLRETDRLSTLAGNFLFFARPPAGKQEKILLDKVIDDILTLFEKDNLLNRGIFINPELARNIYAIMDPVHLHQVMFNLLLNAAEAIQGEGIIRVRLFPLKNNRAGIEISDNGKGIPEETKDMIFDPFYTTKPSGTGLGLSIVHSILETYDSRLNVDSVPDQGTTVSFQLKRVAA